MVSVIRTCQIWCLRIIASKLENYGMYCFLLNWRKLSPLPQKCQMRSFFFSCFSDYQKSIWQCLHFPGCMCFIFLILKYMVHLTVIFVIGGSHTNKGSNSSGSTLQICQKERTICCDCCAKSYWSNRNHCTRGGLVGDISHWHGHWTYTIPSYSPRNARACQCSKYYLMAYCDLFGQYFHNDKDT